MKLASLTINYGPSIRDRSFNCFAIEFAAHTDNCPNPALSPSEITILTSATDYAISRDYIRSEAMRIADQYERIYRSCGYDRIVRNITYRP